MGGKKKGLANRLAKMSDEERARYMQMKADQEEEVRRRKEQLVTTFMKNKIKKEDTFSRLNNAKINQQWHQFMRIRKCREMKEYAEHLKRWIERVMSLKNGIIDNLMKELDEAEFQYSTNLQAHLQHVGSIIEFHTKYAVQLHKEYESDRDLILDQGLDEKLAYVRKAERDIEHSKTLVFGQEIVGQESIKEKHDYYLKLNEEFVKECEDEFKMLRKKNDETTGAIWRDIFALTCGYVVRTDKRRAQLADMRRLDAESAGEIIQNQDRINIEEIQIERFRDEYKTLSVTRKITIHTLKSTIKLASCKSLTAKQNLQSELILDEKKLRFLTNVSQNCITDMENLVKKGENVLQLAQVCRKYETEKEKVFRFPDLAKDYLSESSSTSSTDEISRFSSQNEGIVEEVFMKLKQDSVDIKTEDDRVKGMKRSSISEDESMKGITKIEESQKYKILIKHKYKPKFERKKSIVLGEKFKKQLELVPVIPSCSKRRSKPLKVESLQREDVPSSGIIEESVESLMKLDGIWFLFNKVKLEYSELKKEKEVLSEENTFLKNMIKCVLEDAVLKTNLGGVGISGRSRYMSAPPTCSS